MYRKIENISIILGVMMVSLCVIACIMGIAIAIHRDITGKPIRPNTLTVVDVNTKDTMVIKVVNHSHVYLNKK